MKTEKDHIEESDQTPEFNLPEGFRKLDVFKTPPGYFEKLPLEISGKIHSSPQNVVKSIFPRLAIAAAILIAMVITGSMYFINTSEDEKAQITFTYDDLLNSDLAYEYDDQMIIDHYYSYKSEIPSDTVNGSMNEYLMEDDIDITLIINEL